MNGIHNPAHPGELLREILREIGVTVTMASAKLIMSRVTLSKVLNGRARLTVGLAQRLSGFLGTSPDTWIALQHRRDLWVAEQQGQSNRLKRHT